MFAVFKCTECETPCELMYEVTCKEDLEHKPSTCPYNKKNNPEWEMSINNQCIKSSSECKSCVNGDDVKTPCTIIHSRNFKPVFCPFENEAAAIARWEDK